MGYYYQKKWGQHFLTDIQVIGQIVQAINPQLPDHILEIGPGAGAITELLVDNCARLDAIEIDTRFVQDLCHKYTDNHRITIHNIDILKFNLDSITKEDSVRIVGNLPYNIGSQIIMHLVKFSAKIKDMIFMLQQEVVNSLVAPVGSKAYSRLSVMTQYYYTPIKLFDIAPQAFYPPPKVNSSMVKLLPSIPQTAARNPQHFALVVKTAFGQRRKKISNSLKSLISSHDLDTLSIDSHSRAQDLTMDEYVALSNHTQI